MQMNTKAIYLEKELLECSTIAGVPCLLDLILNKFIFMITVHL